jgi:signal peptidase I
MAEDSPPEGSVPETGGERARSGSPFWRELPFLVIVALVLALLIKTFLVQAFYIPSASMENTLQGGPPGDGSHGSHPYDRVLVNKLTYDFRDPHRGEIVVFKGPPRWPDESSLSSPSNPIAKLFHDVGSVVGLSPASGSDFIKRVIGVGGDTIACNHDKLTVNGHLLVEPYLYPGSRQCSGDNFEGQSKTVPQGSIFVMGDHRDDSADSRQYGFVPVSDVVGRAFVVIWPASDWKTLPIPATFRQAALAVGSSGNLLLIIIVVLIVLAVVGGFWYFHRRRKRAAATPGVA